MNMLHKNPKLKPFLPHIYLGITIALIFAMAIVTNSGPMGMVLGIIAGLGADPVCIATAILVGAVFADYKKFIAMAIITGLITSYIIGVSVDDWRRTLGLPSAGVDIYLYRALAIVILAHVSNVLRVFYSVRAKNDQN